MKNIFIIRNWHLPHRDLESPWKSDGENAYLLHLKPRTCICLPWQKSLLDSLHLKSQSMRTEANWNFGFEISAYHKPTNVNKSETCMWKNLTKVVFHKRHEHKLLDWISLKWLGCSRNSFMQKLNLFNGKYWRFQSPVTPELHHLSSRAWQSPFKCAPVPSPTLLLPLICLHLSPCSGALMSLPQFRVTVPSHLVSVESEWHMVPRKCSAALSWTQKHHRVYHGKSVHRTMVTPSTNVWLLRCSCEPLYVTPGWIEDNNLLVGKANRTDVRCGLVLFEMWILWGAVSGDNIQAHGSCITSTLFKQLGLHLKGWNAKISSVESGKDNDSTTF